MTNRVLSVLVCGVLVLACVELDGDEPNVSTLSSLVSNPTVGGPFAGMLTFVCSNQPGSYLYLPGCQEPLTQASQVVGYMDNAAHNWGCADTAGFVSSVPGGFAKTYGITGNSSACGTVYWNNARQAAFFTANTEYRCTASSCSGATNGTNRRILWKYQALGSGNGALGLPISNPVQYSWTNITYQLFSNGFITYRSGATSAFYAGGTSTDRKTLAAAYLEYFGISPYQGNSIWGLAADVADTCLVAGQTACTSIDKTGDVVRYRDTWWNLDGYFVMRSGWSNAFQVIPPLVTEWNNNIQSPVYNGGTPWSGSTLGFPLTNVKNVGTAANGRVIQMQQFERGAITWQPKTCSAQMSCPAAGSAHCVTYGTVTQDYEARIAKQNTAPVLAGDDGDYYCATQSGSQIAPTCNSTEWIRYAADIVGRYTCDSPVAFPTAITLRIGVGTTHDVLIPREIFGTWLAGGRVENALAMWGTPWFDTPAHVDVRGNIDYMDFPSGRVYAAGLANGSFGVQGKIWELYESLAAHHGVLGYPITASFPLAGYPRYQYFESGYIYAASATQATWSSTAHAQCSDACSSASHMVSAGRSCWQGPTLTTCGEVGRQRGDADLDDIPDALEAALIDRFKPLFKGDFYDRHQAYGIAGSLGGSYAPAVVRFYNGTSSTYEGTDARGFNCGQPGVAAGTFFEDKRCIEILYTTPYNWDLGPPNPIDDLVAHRGDSELVTVLVARRDPYSFLRAPAWGEDWSVASTSAEHWKLISSWSSAHHMRGGWDSSRVQRQRPIGTASPVTTQQVHVAIGKHAGYWSDDLCDDGANYIDECDSAAATTWQLQYRNAGEHRAHPIDVFPGVLIPVPATKKSRDADTSGQLYHMWSWFDFGDSTAFGKLISKGFMQWAPVGPEAGLDSVVCTELQAGNGLPAEVPLGQSARRCYRAN